MSSFSRPASEIAPSARIGLTSRLTIAAGAAGLENADFETVAKGKLAGWEAASDGATVVTDFGGLSFVDSGLTNGNTYSYCARAKDNAATPNTRDSSNTLNGSPTLGSGGGG